MLPLEVVSACSGQKFPPTSVVKSRQQAHLGAPLTTERIQGSVFGGGGVTTAEYDTFSEFDVPLKGMTANVCLCKSIPPNHGKNTDMDGERLKGGGAA